MMFGMSSDHGRLPRMTDLSRFLFGTTSRETAGGGGGAAAKLDVLGHAAVHELLPDDDDSGERTGSRGAPRPAEETPWNRSRSAAVSNNSVPGGSEAAMARSCNN